MHAETEQYREHTITANAYGYVIRDKHGVVATAESTTPHDISDTLLAAFDLIDYDLNPICGAN